MGFRTVVMLNNDRAHDWSKDPNLGQKIAHAMNLVGENRGASGLCPYGEVVECVHADTGTLAFLDGYTMFRPLSHTSWVQGLATDEQSVKALKEAADKLGYRLIRKSK